MSLRSPDWLIEQRRKIYYEMHNIPSTPPSETPDKQGPIHIVEATMKPAPIVRLPICLADVRDVLGREEFGAKEGDRSSDLWKDRLNERLYSFCKMINFGLSRVRPGYTLAYSNIRDAVDNPDGIMGLITLRKDY